VFDVLLLALFGSAADQNDNLQAILLPPSWLHCLARLAAHPVPATGKYSTFLKLAVPSLLSQNPFSGTPCPRLIKWA